MSLLSVVATKSSRYALTASRGFRPNGMAVRCSSSTSSSSTSSDLTGTELANTLAEEHEISKAEAKRIVTSVFDTIAEHLKDKKKVSIANFGTFSIIHAKARNGRNPSNGETILIPAKERVKFSAFKALKEGVNK